MMRRCVVLPKRSPVLSLPTSNGFGPLLKPGVRRQFVLDRPASDARPICFEPAPPKQFAGRRAVRTRRFGTEQLLQQLGHLSRPVHTMIATGQTRFPSLSLLLSTGAK